MASWAEFERQAPELARAVRERFEAHKHLTMATLRADGSPRISGTEVRFAAGELYVGSMLGARKARDLRRDARFAIHSGSDDPPSWVGDAKVSGRMEEIMDAAAVKTINGPEVGPSHLFRAEIEEASLVRLNQAGDRLAITSWHEGGGVAERER